MTADQHQTSPTPECRTIQRQLGPELNLPPAQVTAHLEQCSACRAEAGRLDTAWALLNVLEPRKPSTQFAHRVWAKISAEESPALGARRGGLPVWSLRGVAATAGVVLLAVVPVAVWYQGQHDGPDVVAQLDLMESRDLLTNLEVVEDLDVLLLLDDP